MAKKKKQIKSRDIFMLAIISANGGVVRIFQNKKKKAKQIRKQKHKTKDE